MKKRNALILTLSVLAAVAAVGGCSKAKKEKPTEIICAAPEITVTDEGFHWATVQGAGSYLYKFGENEWANASVETPIAFPQTTGDYVLYLKAQNQKGTDGGVTEYAFSVTTMSVTCTQLDNALVFEGDRIYYSVNGDEEGRLSEEKTIDFSNAAVGTEFVVEYYAKGGFWSDSDKTYYLDSAKQKKSLTVSEQLSMPELSINDNGTHLEWLTSEHASGYKVTLDGAEVMVDKENPAVALSATLGKHTVTVQALGQGSWSSSLEAIYSYTTVCETVVPVTYDDENALISWDKKYDGLMLVAADGETYETAEECSVTASVGLKIKLASYFDETEKRYYLESKPLSVEKRATPTMKFSPSGEISWNEQDTGSLLRYYVMLDGKDEEFSLSIVNGYVLPILEAGEYTMFVKAADCIYETEEGVKLYLTGETQSLTFFVLAKPELSYAQGKLLWVIDENAAGYEYRKDGGEWQTATTAGCLETTEMATYEVRPIASSEDGKYSVVTGSSELFFDPSLTQSNMGVYQLATFNNEKYAQTVGLPDIASSTKSGNAEIVLSSEDAAESAILAGADGGVLKLTAGNAGLPFLAHWGISDGVKFNLFKAVPVELNAYLVFRVYVIGKEERLTAGVKDLKGRPQTAEGYYIGEDGKVYDSEDKEVVGASAVQATENIEGHFAFGATGSHVAGTGMFAQSSWLTGNARIPVDTWTDVYVPMTTNFVGYEENGQRYGMSDIQSVTMHFIRNAVKGDVFYIDEIRYENIKFPTETEEVDFEANPDMKVGFSSSYGSLDIVKDDGYGKDVLKFTQGSNMPTYGVLFLNSKFENVPLHRGDKIVVEIKTSGPRFNMYAGVTPNGTYENGEMYLGWVESSKTRFEVAVKEDTFLQSFYCNSSASENTEIPYEVWLASFKIVRLEKHEGFVNSFTHLSDYSMESKVDANEGKYLSITTGADWNDALLVQYENVKLFAGMQVTFRVRMVSGWLKVYVGNVYKEIFVPDGYTEDWYEFKVTLTENVTLGEIKINCGRDKMDISKITFPSVKAFDGFVDAVGYSAHVAVTETVDGTEKCLALLAETDWKDVVTVYYEGVSLASGSTVTFRLKMASGYLKLYVGNEYFEHFIPSNKANEWYEFSVTLQNAQTIQSVKIHSEKQEIQISKIVLQNAQ